MNNTTRNTPQQQADTMPSLSDKTLTAALQQLTHDDIQWIYHMIEVVIHLAPAQRSRLFKLVDSIEYMHDEEIRTEVQLMSQ